MTLMTEEGGDVPDVDLLVLDEVLASDAFGKFAVLCESDEAFVQAGNDWQSGAETEAFLRTHDSDPWLLEYRAAGRQFRATGPVTLDQVRTAFRAYLAGLQEWRSSFVWSAIQV